ncbi:hypothetical protein PBI_CANTARE_42 [Brevibacterium phage Cantare]|uniref:Uncharacterized protein n=1 Tax=Brevibacterium phage Cantare TaxID=2338395 RepID=A0A3G3LYP0_9CAUD|nr:hypothetical protein PQD70_gp042 [Brevibacterium phage Cantare]AYQ99262.1 hypothetical protein PBI_CANTARE_42 [Brevibacterium phage Cantare]
MPVRKGIAELWVKSTSRMRLVGMILVILAVGSSLQIIWTNQVRRDLMECQIQFMDQTVKSLDIRSKTSNEASEALESLIAGLKDSPDGVYTERLYAEYLTKRQEQKQVQVANPYPTIELGEACYGE